MRRRKDERGKRETSKGGGSYLAENARVEAGLLKELDGDLAHHNADALGVGLAEELAIDLLLIDREVEVRSWEERTELVRPY